MVLAQSKSLEGRKSGSVEGQRVSFNLLCFCGGTRHIAVKKKDRRRYTAIFDCSERQTACRCIPIHPLSLYMLSSTDCTIAHAPHISHTEMWKSNTIFRTSSELDYQIEHDRVLNRFGTFEGSVQLAHRPFEERHRGIMQKQVEPTGTSLFK